MLDLDDKCSNIGSFVNLFSDGVGVTFREAIAYSFSFASGAVRTIQALSIRHQLELWDQAVSYKLGRILISDPILANGVDIHLEKQDSKIVWHYGFSILKTDRERKTRQWVLPDGLIRRANAAVAIEFDHGITVGKWANQLLKAIRVLASDKICGVIYCFCFERGSSINKLSIEEMTNEFRALVDCNGFKKPIGFITILPFELRADLPAKSEVIDFLEIAYLSNSNKAIESKRKAENIVKVLRRKN